MRKIVTIFKQLFKGSRQVSHFKTTHTPIIIKREDHCISRNHISQAAIKVLYRLHNSGFAAYLVGGGVRDLLLGHDPKDFDVVTDAHPEQIQRLFKNSFIIGRRFRLVHVRFGNEIIEVATFRGSTEDAKGRVQTQRGLLLRDNVYGTLEDDVWRRDFTINALYYNIADFSVVDYTGGMKDLDQKSIRVIGDPTDRFHEDPARMLRALRFAAKLDFVIEPRTAGPIKKHRELLSHVPPARLFDKILKVFHSGKSFATFQLFHEYNIVSVLFPQMAAALKQPEPLSFLMTALKNTDERVNQDKTINSAFLLAVLLWRPLLAQKEVYKRDEDTNEYQAFNMAMADVVQEQLKIISIPRRFTTVMREIWSLQYHLENARVRRVHKVFHHPRFRAGYDFFGLRYQSGEVVLKELYEWWTEFQEGDEEARSKLISHRFSKAKPRKRKKKRPSSEKSLPGTGQ
ncbi:MAG: polynucleotide adenylyltransferase PcnB [Gammaproteobacteria bacterium]|nr:polynucleotide adenylyltransferase PcnB [Gammaproteobacteria bacterium]